MIFILELGFMTFKSRIYYRNTFLHIGHLQTLCYNNDFAEQNNGQCCAIVDDRQDEGRIKQIQIGLDYLKLNNIKVIPVSAHNEFILLYTKELVKDGDVYITHCANTDDALNELEDPSRKFQIRLNYGDSPTIGYSKEDEHNPGKHVIVFIFDYIIKVIDLLLNITDVVTTSLNDVTDRDIMGYFTNYVSSKIKYHRLDTYKIIGFRYSKRDWPALPEDDPRLMTLMGLKSRYVPSCVIKKFYNQATDLLKFGSYRAIKITQFDAILRNYLNATSLRAFGVLDPLEITLTNVEERYLEYAMKPCHPNRTSQYNIVPLTRRVWIDKNDFSLVQTSDKLSKNTSMRLKYANVIYCTDVILNRDRVKELKVKYYPVNDKNQQVIHWVSCKSDEETPRKVRYYIYNRFFTGENILNEREPIIKEGYIDETVFKDLDRVYQLERIGYFRYDKDLSESNNITCFIKICGIK